MKLTHARAVALLLATLAISAIGAACGNSNSMQGPEAASVDSAVAVQIAAQSKDAALAVASIQANAASSQPRIRQIISFGDSLSDVGTYRVGLIAQVGGGKFTTNPGPVFVEAIGLLLGTPVTPFRQGFGGTSQVLGGTGFAMGGARVSQQPGIGCDPDPGSGICTGALTIPVVDQITDYLTANSDAFRSDQLVFVWAGANDVLFQLAAFGAKVGAGQSATQAAAEAIAAVEQAALDLASQVNRIIAKGATRVIVLNLPDIASTPFGKAPAQAQVLPLIADLVLAFNGALDASLTGTSAVLLDFFAAQDRQLANPKAYGYTNINTPACDPVKIAAITEGLDQDGSSLFCSPLTLVKPFAGVQFAFADLLHPTTLGHLNLAGWVAVEPWHLGLL
ncbi:MAG TPA: SGNH/GDSL hydrolase family protein [Anaeromyxobacteraceae bacterium]|nr:SGNH/GDSL hydrolase family protein [Anaeromyxobacteraceae bacterium]